ncbi:SAM-dependent methyltransferase [Superficieibacter electus]|uniref:SAM-dependent methyltransferase n=1 Tax=Superficieibacter electus TaxID=2022662 RepID=A0A2P5GVA3_9ENTR|nr:class I SAM-dependent methyltransferase [Superficieibacter electus]POP42303.1 SAM-dependent methyltransferase [Superficieibacter electus]POP50492.1 SAM-dependent methyltransferase [Superficieibacter electus]
MSINEKAGHTFLASLGKTRLRPGGIEATEWLFSQARLTLESQVLEIACNMATTAIELAQRFGCQVIAVDMDKDALAKAKANVVAHGLEQHIQVMPANANSLPFADNSFDVVINEAMLTMYADKAKAKLLGEYYRVLKPGGRLLTHDIMFTAGRLAEGEQHQLQQVVKSNVSPMTRQGWQEILLASGFTEVTQHNGEMSLMSPQGLIRDEGIKGAVRIVFNGLRTRQNRTRFLGMFRFFRSQRRHLNYIACCSVKGH